MSSRGVSPLDSRSVIPSPAAEKPAPIANHHSAKPTNRLMGKIYPKARRLSSAGTVVDAHRPRDRILDCRRCPRADETQGEVAEWLKAQVC